MSLWIGVIALALISAALKAAGPAILGQHAIPQAARRLVAVLPAVVLTALVVSDVAGERWAHTDWYLVAGVAAAATARLLRMPMLAALLVSVATTAGLRAIA